VKRIQDPGATAIGGASILPLFLMLTLLVYVESGRPVFYRDQRMGRDGTLFSCAKFRTMVPGAEAMLLQLLEENAWMRKEYSKYHKVRDDPRVTRIGRFLRKTSLDELPKLWNVIRGEMNLVGPRPYLPRESKEMGLTQSEILRVPPGVTGPWQVAGRNKKQFRRKGQDGCRLPPRLFDVVGSDASCPHSTDRRTLAWSFLSVERPVPLDAPNGRSVRSEDPDAYPRGRRDL
jgi:lipopolysaccharide/colanic/teichoic acid biosynthesis glycosyltransferase